MTASLNSKLILFLSVVLVGLIILTAMKNRPGEVFIVMNQEPESEKIVAVTEDEFSVADRGFWQGMSATKKHIFDETLAASLLEFFKYNVTATSILELGAGLGNYAELFMSKELFISCYDGNPNTQELSGGRCAVIDLSKPMDFCQHDWVMSLEVGEHIPNQFEDNFISNLDKGNKKGLVISWAVEGQGGTSHVNNHNNDYIRAKFEKLGYASDLETEAVLRASATWGWFKDTVMVFHRL